MSDLDRKFRLLDDFQTPDAWEEVIDRQLRTEKETAPARRLLTAVLALGLFAASGFFAWTALRPSGTAGPASGAAEEVPDVLHLSCAADGTPTISATTVQSQPDGLHVIVDDPGAADEIWVQQRSRPGFTWSSGSSSLREEFVMLVPPGESFVQCRDYERLPDPPQGDAWMAIAPHFTLVDPNGSWVSVDLSCDNPTVVTDSFSNDAALSNLSPPDAARASVPGIRDTDVVESAGYPGSADEARAVRVVRDGAVIASLRQSDGDPGLFHGYACPGSGIGGV